MLPLGPLLQLLKYWIVAGQNFRLGLLVRQNLNAKRVNTLQECFRSVAQAFLSHFRNFWRFRSILDVRAVINSQYIVNILLSPALRSSGGCSNPCNY